MNKYALYFGLVLFTSCLTKNSKRDFIGYPNKLLAIGTIENQKEESLFEFYDQTNKRVSSGNYLKGLRNSKWYYNIADSLIEIQWAPFVDKNLGFETNVFAVADTAYYGDFFTQIDYTVEKGKLSLVVSINSPLKDSLNKKQFKNIVAEELSPMNFTLGDFSSAKRNHISIFKYSSVSNESKKELYHNSAYGLLGNDFIQITITSNDGVKKEFNDIFFEAVVTNLYFKTARFYYPFSK